MNKCLVLLFFLASTSFLSSQPTHPLEVSDDLTRQQVWVDSIYAQMTLQEKVGQLFMVDVFSRDSKAKTDAVKMLIERYHLGGVIFSKGGPLRQARLTNELQDGSILT